MNLVKVRQVLRSKGIVHDEPGAFYSRWLRARPHAAGPDGVTTSTWFMETTEAERMAQAERWLSEPVTPRAAYREIVKAGGGTRGIATFNRSYQAALYAVAEVVGPIIERQYTDAVVGFRPGYRLDETVIDVMMKSRTDFPILLTADIRHFFDEIDLAFLDRFIDGLDELDADLREWLKVHARTELVGRDGEVVSAATRTKGIAQGSVLAPLLANLDLIDFDRRIKKRLGHGYYRRYADNLGVLVKTTGEASRIEDILREELARLRLHVKPGSNRIADVNNAKNTPSFLGIAWTRERAWADPDAIAKKVERLKLDIQLGRKDFTSVDEYLDGLKRYFESVLAGEAANDAVRHIEELLGPELLRTEKGARKHNNRNDLCALREHQRAQHVQEGQPNRMLIHTSNQPPSPSTGTTNGKRDKTERYASGWNDHGRESYRESTTNALSGWKDGTLDTSPSTPSDWTLAEAREQGFHPRCPPQHQDAVGLDQAQPRVRHAVIRVDRALAVVAVSLDGVRVERAVPGRVRSPTETELAGLVLGWDLAVECRAVAVTFKVEDFFVRKYLDGAYRVGRPWNAYWLDALVARLDEPTTPMWQVEMAVRREAAPREFSK